MTAFQAEDMGSIPFTRSNEWSILNQNNYMLGSPESSPREAEPNPDQVSLEHILERAGFRVGQRVQLPCKSARDMGTLGVIAKPMFADYCGRMVPAVEVTYTIGQFNKAEHTEVVLVHELYDLNPVPPKSDVAALPITERLNQSAFQPSGGYNDNRFSIGLYESDQNSIQAKVQELVRAVLGTTPDDVRTHPDSYRIYAEHVRNMVSGCNSRANEIANDSSRRSGGTWQRDQEHDQRRMTPIRTWQLQLEEILAKLQTMLPEQPKD